MFRKILEKIDKFYFILVTVLIVSAVIVVVTFKGIFSSVLTAYEITLEEGLNEFQVDEEKQSQAVASYYDQEKVKLEINEELKSQ